MDLTSELVERKAREYRDTAPLYAVEREHVEMLPDMLASGDFGWRDPEWVVQWYYRRGTVSDAERREAEERFLDNDYEAMVDAMTDDYMVYAYPGDVRSFLDDAVRTLDAVEALAEVDGDDGMADRARRRRSGLL